MDITGLILAGGHGSRMGSIDKGLAPLGGDAPCDSPFLPTDLVERLSAAMLAANADLAVAITGATDARQPHPVFCLTTSFGAVASAFRYINTLADLRELG